MKGFLKRYLEKMDWVMIGLERSGLEDCLGRILGGSDDY
jgi:hypothetical protein